MNQSEDIDRLAYWTYVSSLLVSGRSRDGSSVPEAAIPSTSNCGGKSDSIRPVTDVRYCLPDNGSSQTSQIRLGYQGEGEVEMKKCMSRSVVFAAMLMLNVNAFAVSIMKHAEVVSGAAKHIGFGWSDDNKHFIVSEYHADTQRQHSCIYSVEPLKKIKCVLAHYPLPDLYVGSIAWVGNTLYVDEGYVDGRAIVKYEIGAWNKFSFREIDASQKDAGKGLGGDGGARPVWDQWQNGLYYQEGWASGNIYIHKDGKQHLVAESAFEPAASERYFWYVLEDPVNGLDDPHSGVYRRNRVTHHEVRIAEVAESISATKDDNLLFVLQAERTSGYRNALFSYQASNDKTTRLFDVSGVIGQIQEVAVSTDGQYALVEIYSTDRKYDPEKVFYSVVLLKLAWQTQ